MTHEIGKDQFYKHQVEQSSRLQVERLRQQILGTWHLITWHAELISDPTNRIYPLGPEAKGRMVYNHDGYMSAQVMRPGQAAFDEGSGVDPSNHGTDEEWTLAGRNFMGYSGRFFIKVEDGEVALYHELDICIYPRLRGQVQKRLVRLAEENGETILNLGVDKIEVAGEVRTVKVKWRRAEDNSQPS